MGRMESVWWPRFRWCTHDPRTAGRRPRPGAHRLSPAAALAPRDPGRRRGRLRRKRLRALSGADARRGGHGSGHAGHGGTRGAAAHPRPQSPGPRAGALGARRRRARAPRAARGGARIPVEALRPGSADRGDHDGRCRPALPRCQPCAPARTAGGRRRRKIRGRESLGAGVRGVPAARRRPHRAANRRGPEVVGIHGRDASLQRQAETRRVKPGRAHADRDPPPSDRALGSYVAVPRPSRPPRPGSENQVMESTSVPPRPRGRVKLPHPLYTLWQRMPDTPRLHVDDVDRDPYSARRGFWFSHIGWMLREYASGRPDFSNIPDLKRDSLLAFQHRYYVPLAVALNIGLPLLLGILSHDVWGMLILAGVLRLVWSHHITFFINSLAHMWGSRPYTDENTARDNPVIAVVTYGEGYHNFHHIFAHDYRNGVRWWQWDPTKWLIAGLQVLGLTRRLKRTPVFQIQRALLAMQFRRARERLASNRHAGRSHLEQLRARVAHEYESFLAALADWSRVKDQWLGEKKRAVSEHWEQLQLQARLREIERRLSRQLRRMRILQAPLA